MINYKKKFNFNIEEILERSQLTLLKNDKKFFLRTLEVSQEIIKKFSSVYFVDIFPMDRIIEDKLSLSETKEIYSQNFDKKNVKSKKLQRVFFYKGKDPN